MRIGFLGTPEFARPSLQALLEAGHTIAFVVTQPDRPVGRGRKTRPTAIKVAAQAAGLPVLQPERVSSAESIEAIKAFAPDLLAVVAFGQILSDKLLNLPRLGAVNVHASLLPRWRGAAPIQRAILNGDTETGVTTMWMAARLDAGDIILQQAVPISPQDTAGTLSDRLAVEGARLLARTVGLVEAGSAPRLPQNESRVTLAPPIRPEEGLIAWSSPAGGICNLVRALNPAPGAFTHRAGQRIKVWQARAVVRAEGKPGQVVEVMGDGIAVAAGSGAVVITQVQPESRRIMDAGAYARGYRLAATEMLG